MKTRVGSDLLLLRLVCGLLRVTTWEKMARNCKDTWQIDPDVTKPVTTYAYDRRKQRRLCRSRAETAQEQRKRRRWKGGIKLDGDGVGNPAVRRGEWIRRWG